MTARDFALIELDFRPLPHWPANLIKSPRRNVPADPRDLALAEQIIVGTIKNLLFLDHCITHYSGRALKQIDPLVRKILAIAMYQLAFLDRVPASAAVNEAVKQIRKFGRSRSAGFVNAVLRNATRQPGPPAPPLPDPAVDPQGYAELALSHPPRLFQKLSELLGPERALQFCRHDNAEPPTIVRLLQGAEPSAIESDGVRITPHDQAGMYVVQGARQSTLADWADRALAQVQDPTAAGVVDRLSLSEGLRVLDRCAGMGTKTMQIRQRVGAAGFVAAVEPSAARVAAMQRLVHDRNLDNVKIFQTAWLAEAGSDLPASFDRILVDAPCSNSGVLPRRPEARYRQDERTIESLRRLQIQILDDSADRLSPRGLLVYSTCSVWAEENETQITAFLQRHADFKLAGQWTTLPSFEESEPSRYHDGGFTAALAKAE